MIKLTNRFNQFAYAVPMQVSDTLMESGFEEGTWVVPSADGITLPTAGAKAYMVCNSKREGRDQMSGKAANVAEVWVGSFVVDTNKIAAIADGGTAYAAGQPLYVDADGCLTNVVDEDGVIVAYVLGVYSGADYGNNIDDNQYDGFIRIVAV